jgi:hypothetical protein
MELDYREPTMVLIELGVLGSCKLTRISKSVFDPEYEAALKRGFQSRFGQLLCQGPDRQKLQDQL